MNPRLDPYLEPCACVSQKRNRAGGEITVYQVRLCPTHPQCLVRWGCSEQANEKNKQINQSMNIWAKRWWLLVEYQFQGGLPMFVMTCLDCRMWEFSLKPKAPAKHFQNRPWRYYMMNLAGTINHLGKQSLNLRDEAADKRGILYGKHGC